MSPRRLWIQVAAIFVIAYLALLGARPMITPDEARYGGMAADMLASGEWFRLRMVGFTYYEKPPMGTWMMAASIAAFGHDAFAIRLPGALATLVGALAAGSIARRITGRREAAPLAATVHLTTVFPMVLGCVALLDPIFAGFVALTLAWFVAGAQASGQARLGWLLAAGAAAGCAFLTKGLLGFAIPALAAGGWLAWERRWRDLVTLAWPPMLGATLAAAVPAWLIHRAEPHFWRYFIEVEHFRRFARPDANQHAEPVWLLPLVLVAGGMCWTLFWPRAWAALRAQPQARPVARFALVSIVLPLAFLSLSKGKLPTYVLPLFPPLAALVASGMLAWRAGVQRSWDRGTTVALTVVTLAATGAFALALVGGARLGLPRLWPGDESTRWALLGLALLAWATLEARAHRATSAESWLARLAWVPVPALVCVHLLLPEAILSAPKAPWRLLARHHEALVHAPAIATVDSMAHAINWTTGRTDLRIVGRAGEFDNELGIASERARLVDGPPTRDRLRAWAREDAIVLVLDKATVPYMLEGLEPFVVWQETDRGTVMIGLRRADAP